MRHAVWTWFLAARPWTFSTSATPVILGSVLAWGAGHPFQWGLFLMTLAAGMLLHAGVNYLNTFGDYVSGVDTVESADSCPHLVRGILRPAGVRLAGLICLGLAGLLGLILAARCGWPVLLYGLLGLVGGYCYTTSPRPYKYLGLGPVMVFFLMGPLMVCPAYFIQSGQVPFGVVWVSLAIGCLVTGVIQANDIHDLNHDRASGIRTMAMALGRRRAIIVYCGCYVGAYLILLTSVGLGLLPAAALLPLLLLPALIRTICGLARRSRREGRIAGLLFWSARFHTQFGVLLVAGLIASGLWVGFGG